MRLFLLLVYSLLFLGCQGQNAKINGVSFVAAPEQIDQEDVEPITKVHANWAAVMPFGFVKDLSSPEVIYNVERQWIGEREEGVKQTISLLKAQDIRVMLKPQIWVWRGEFTGELNMKSETQWKAFEASYRDYILSYAKLAQDLKVPLFCIGTELHTFVQTRSEFWKELIQEIRKVYQGDLTYAENWDQYQLVPFWKELDYIGVDAYFPLSDKKEPSVKDFKEGWKKHKEALQKFSEQLDKSLLFTEFGYRSMDYNGKEPWNSERFEGKLNFEAQNNALEAIITEFWNEPWFAGGFLWKWYHNHKEAGGMQNNRFTVQNKPAENILKKYYVHF